MSKSHRAAVSSPPRAARVYTVRWQLPDEPSKAKTYLTEPGALRRAEGLSEAGAEVAVYVADIEGRSKGWQPLLAV